MCSNLLIDGIAGLHPRKGKVRGAEEGGEGSVVVILLYGGGNEVDIVRY